jgi:hypothetical protein
VIEKKESQRKKAEQKRQVHVLDSPRASTPHAFSVVPNRPRQDPPHACDRYSLPIGWQVKKERKVIKNKRVVHGR